MFNNNTNPYQRYRQTQIETASQLELIIMMYDGALRFINQAKQAINEKNYVSANNLLLRAQAVIDELNYSLNMDAGEIAQNLRNLYVFINRQIIDANIKKDPSLLEQVIEVLNTLRSSWVELQNSKKQTPQAEQGQESQAVSAK